MMGKYSFLLCVAFVPTTIWTLPAEANVLTSATASANCAGFNNLAVNATDLAVGSTLYHRIHLHL